MAVAGGLPEKIVGAVPHPQSSAMVLARSRLSHVDVGWMAWENVVEGRGGAKADTRRDEGDAAAIHSNAVVSEILMVGPSSGLRSLCVLRRWSTIAAMNDSISLSCLGVVTSDCVCQSSRVCSRASGLKRAGRERAG